MLASPLPFHEHSIIEISSTEGIYDQTAELKMSVGDESIKEIRFLFRFRDLVARTIDSHNEIIQLEGSVWWGWWKRPTEDDRNDVWEALGAAITAQKKVPVGLFDSGSGTVYRAWINEIIPPVDTELRNPPSDKHLVPLYYRESPFSHAWMRISEIEAKSVDFFNSFSFQSVPILPNYSPVTLNQFKDKVIISEDELRGMDTTIWEVRKSTSTDRKDKILLAVKALPSPSSSEIVTVKSNYILHITDPHFATGAHRKQHVWKLESEGAGGVTLAESITKALGQKKIGLVVFTGDLTFSGQSSEFDEALLSIYRLCGTLDIGTDQIVVVPGNHDINWAESKESYDESAEVTLASEAAKAGYKRFYRNLFRHEPNDSLSMARRFGLPCGRVVEISALNSSSLETGKNFLAGMGRIDENAFASTAGDLGWDQKDASSALRILAVHHHLALTEDLESSRDYYRGFGIAVDAVRTQRMAARFGVQLALHGHKHRAFLWRSTVYELPEQTSTKYRLGELSIVGGGSAGSSETTENSNYFNILEVSASGLSLSIQRARNKGAFSESQQWLAKFEDQDTGVVLSDWSLRPATR
jgi:predicted phosphodiesterase